jgi:hypothetical protein
VWFGFLWWEGDSLVGDSTALAGGFEFFVAGGVDFILPAGEAVCRGDVADGAMQGLGIVVVDEVAGDALGVFKGQWGFGGDGLLFERFMEAFEFSVGLGIVGTGPDIAGLPLGDEGFEKRGRISPSTERDANAWLMTVAGGNCKTAAEAWD